MQTRCIYIGIAMAGLLALTMPETASANGRFPAAQQLVVSPSDAQQITVQTTYGFILTKNGGKDWSWICEDAALYGGILDPPIAILSDGTLIAGVFNGLTVASPDGCNLAFVPGDLAQRYVVDVAAEKVDPSHAIALSSNGLGNSTFDTRLWQTQDNGKTWAQAGVPLPPSFLALTGDAAPSDPNRVYLSGYTIASSTSYVGSLALSTDRGATWNVTPIPGSTDKNGPYIGAIAPNDPLTVYVRTGGDVGQLMVTHDAGVTWKTIFTGQSALLGFALSPDGQTVLVGSVSDGVMRASVSDYAFTQVNPLHARCLTWVGDTIYACGQEAQDGMTIGISHDHGATFEAIDHLSCLEGPLTCPAGSDVATKCGDPWLTTSMTLQTNTCVSGSSATSSSVASSSSGGTTSNGKGSSCSYAVESGRRSLPELLFAGLALAVTLGRRRLRRRLGRA